MANASKDANFTNSFTTALNTDGTTIVKVQADPSTHFLKINDGTIGSDFGPANALHDANNVPTVMAVSSVDGVTPVVLYSDSSGKLLIQST